MTNRIVIYIDGSSRPNPGKSGWGAHGYKYCKPSVNPRRLDDYYITSVGYLDKQQYAKHQECVEPTEFYDFCVFEDQCETNNAAELFALYRTLDYFKSHELEQITIYTDSEYVRKGLTEYTTVWIKNNWRRADGREILHSSIWKEILAHKAAYEARGIVVNLEWVKGHAGTYGNILADRLASIAALKGYSQLEYSDYGLSPAAGYGKATVERHPFICFKRLYFSSSSEISDVGRYFIAEPGDDSDIGRRMSEATYSVIASQISDPVLEAIKEKQRSVSRDLTRTVMVRLDRAYDKDIYPYISRYGSDCLISTGDYRANLNFIDSRNVTSEMVPAGLSLKAMETFALLETLLCQYSQQQLSSEYQTIDITDRFYDVTGSKRALKPEFIVGFKDLSLAVEIQHNGQTRSISVPLSLGGDLLPRNNLKRIETMQPQITLLIWEESYNVYRYACAIQVEDALGIWSNYYSNRILLV